MAVPPSLPDGPDALAESYEFRLLLEPAAILTPGFRLDGAGRGAAAGDGSAAGAARCRVSTSAEFQRLDLEFHGLIADGSANRFLADALAAHLRLRPPAGPMPASTCFA